MFCPPPPPGAAEGTAAPVETEMKREVVERRNPSHQLLTRNRLETGTLTQDHKHPHPNLSFLFLCKFVTL